MSPRKGKYKQSLSTENGEGQKRRKIDELTAKLSTKDSEINDLLEETHNLGDDLARKTHQLKAVKSQLEDAEEELEKAKYEIEILRSERKCLEITNRKLEEALESLRVSKQKEVSPSEREQLIKQKYKSLKASAIKMSSELQEWTSIEPEMEPEAFKVEYHRLKQELKDVKAELGVLRGERHDYRQLKQEYKAIKAELEAFKRGRDELKKTHGQKEIIGTILKKNPPTLSANRQQPAPDSNDEDEAFEPARIDNDDDVPDDHDDVPDEPEPFDEPVKLPENKTEEQYIRIKCGKLGKYHILVSDARWLTMDWTKEYTYLERGKVRCKKCEKMSSNLRDATDHSWVEHYGGHFKCAYCDNPAPLRFRHSFKAHMKKQHPDIPT